MANTTPTLADLFGSPEHKGEMNESVREQIKKALAETKIVPNNLQKGSKTSKKSSRVVPSLTDLTSSPEYSGMNPEVQKQIQEAIAQSKIVSEKPKEQTSRPNKKKLPTKPKIDIGDSIIVVDKNEKVGAVVPPEAKPQANVSSEDKLEGNQSFKGTLKDRVLKLGTKSFNRMFPTLGRAFNVLKSRLEKQEKNASDNNAANKSYAQQVERSSVFLTNITDGQNRTNELLQQILVAVNSRNATSITPSATVQNADNMMPDIDIDTDRRRNGTRRAQTVPNTSPSNQRTGLRRAGRYAAIGAGAAAAAGAGYLAYNALTDRNDARPEPDESGTFRNSATGFSPVQVEFSRAGGKHTLNGVETDRETYSRFRQLSMGRHEDDPRYAQYVQEGRQGPDSFFAEHNALSRVSQERNQELRELVQRVQRGESSAPRPAEQQPGAQAPATGQPATSQTPTARPATGQTPAGQSATRQPVTGTQQPVTQRQTTTPGSPSDVSPTTNPGGFNPRMLNVRAEEILFKADRFEYSQGSAAGVSSGGSSGGDGASAGGGSSGGGITPNTITAPSGGGSSTPSGASQTGAPQLTSIRTKSGKNVQVAASVADRFRGFLNDLEGTGYQIRDIGGYANRPNVNNPSVMSVHASGMAIDINPAENPNRSTRTDMPPETAQIAAKWGLGWGMNWRSVKDPMHFSAASNEGGGAPQPGATQAATPSASPAASAGGEGAASSESGTGATPAASPSTPAATPAPASPSTGAAVSSASVADETASRPAPVPPPAPPDASAPITASPQGPSLPGIDPNNPGPVEPADAGIRYSRLFNIAA